jgi:hypothetical protein
MRRYACRGRSRRRGIVTNRVLPYSYRLMVILYHIGGRRRVRAQAYEGMLLYVRGLLKVSEGFKHHAADDR